MAQARKKKKNKLLTIELTTERARLWPLPGSENEYGVISKPLDFEYFELQFFQHSYSI
jgi:hypothetical protein